MKAERATKEILLTNSAVFALVGPRIYPVVIPEGSEYPCISYQRIDGSHITAPLLALADPGAGAARLQITAWGKTYESAKAVAEAARIALQRWRGTIAGIVVWDIVTAGDGPDLYDNDLLLYGAPSDYTISHPE